MRTGISGGLALALAFVLSACGSPFADLIAPESPHPHPELVRELDQNVERWAAAGITRYAFTYTPSCFCASRTHLVIVEGDVVRIDGAKVDPTEPLHDFTPVGVPGLFAIVRQAINGDRTKVTYDPATGVPVAMESDPMENAIDDELSFTLNDWTLDPPDDTVLGKVSAARDVWDQRQFVRYTMTIRIDCTCVYDGRSFTTTDRGGDLVVMSDGQRIDPDTLDGVPLRVESLFDFAMLQATNGRTSIEFDPQLGYPRRIVVGPDPTVAGQDETIEVLRFTAP